MAIDGDNVRALNGSSLDNDALKPFIDAAECLVGNISVCIANQEITPTCVDSATAFLACHLLAGSKLGEKTLVNKMEKFEGWSVTRAIGVMASTGILSTNYGQTANALLGGCLQETDKRNALVCHFG